MATAVYTQNHTISLEALDDAGRISLEGCQTPVSQQGSEVQATHSAQTQELSRARASILVTTLTGLTFVGSMSGGLLTVCLPGIAKDLNLPDSLLLW